MINPQNFTQYCALIIHIEQQTFEKFEDYCTMNVCTPLEAIRQFITKMVKEEFENFKSPLGVDFYLSLLSELQQKIDYELSNYGETEEYFQLCERVDKIEAKILALQKQNAEANKSNDSD